MSSEIFSDPKLFGEAYKKANFPEDTLDLVKMWFKEEMRFTRRPEVSPILHNNHLVILQMSGWAIILYEDGTWVFDADTSGG